jgi:SAM-dependent methyltransferase
MDWTAGYASDVEYTSGFYREQSPTFLNFVCVVNGIEPIPLDQEFTYFELGFGRGLTVNVLAASNPQGRFYAADFNPAHVAGARELAASAQLDNLVLLEASFEDLAAGKETDLPQFDFITLHGIYTWVTAENQRHIVDFLGRYLKPGGVVFLSYNAMPGWAAALPLQRLLVEYGGAFPNRSDVQVKGAAQMVQRMQDANAAYFTANTSLKPRLDSLTGGSVNYLVHEYMHKHWAPLYHADVARDLAVAKMEYVGSADLPLAFPNLYLTEEKQAIVNTLSSAPMRETMKDYFLNTAFRKDVFVRGARKMGLIRQWEWLAQVGLALIIPYDQTTLEMKLGISTVNGKREIFSPILAALAQRPHTLGELAALPALRGESPANLGQAAALLTASGQTSLYFVDSASQACEPAQRMSRVLAGRARYKDEYQVLCSPLLGNGQSATLIERLVYAIWPEHSAEIDAAHMARDIWKIIVRQGRKMIKDGKTLQTDEENIAEIASQVREVLEVKVPLWRALKIKVDPAVETVSSGG